MQNNQKSYELRLLLVTMIDREATRAKKGKIDMKGWKNLIYCNVLQFDLYNDYHNKIC